MYELIKKAIEGKKLIEFAYHSQVRIVEPYVLGVNKGVVQLLGYQTGGTSNTPGLPTGAALTFPTSHL